MSFPAAISLVTLGVRDVPAATRFYEDLGLRRSGASVEGEVSFFHTAGSLLAVWRADELQRDAEAGAGAEPGTFRGVALAINVGSEAEVDGALRAAEAAGANQVRKARKADWGGYQGYFADPDGHYWEVAYNPYWPLGADGLPQLPE